jgi:hypothetical protein
VERNRRLLLRTNQQACVSRDSEVERNETELVRETGSNAPSTKQHVEFLYRIATRPPPRQNKSV